jgi:hypothetical protein
MIGNCKLCNNWWKTATDYSPHWRECLILCGDDTPQPRSLAHAFEASFYTHETFGCVQYQRNAETYEWGGWGVHYKPRVGEVNE